MTAESVNERVVSSLPRGNEFRFSNENFLLGPHVYPYEFKLTDLNEHATRLVNGVKDRFFVESFKFESLLIGDNKKSFSVVFVDSAIAKITTKTPKVAEMVRYPSRSHLGKYDNNWGLNVLDIDPLIAGTNLRTTEAYLRYNEIRKSEKSRIFNTKTKEVIYYQMGVASLSIHLTELAVDLGFVNDDIRSAQENFEETLARLESRKGKIEERIIKNPTSLFD